MTAQPRWDYATCAVCRRSACGLGSAVHAKAPVAWYCAECGPELAKRIGRMPKQRLDMLEDRAVVEAGDIAGRYLDELGQSDLGSLSEVEWKTFLTTFLTGYEGRMRELVRGTEDVPF